MESTVRRLVVVYKGEGEVWVCQYEVDYLYSRVIIYIIGQLQLAADHFSSVRRTSEGRR